MLVQVLMLAELHDDVHTVLVRDERIVVANDVRRVHTGHDLDLADGFVVCTQSTCINLFDGEETSVTILLAHLVNLSVAAFTEGSLNDIIVPRWIDGAIALLRLFTGLHISLLRLRIKVVERWSFFV